MTFKPCDCEIYDCSTRQNLIAGHRYCHALWNKMNKNPDGDFKYTKTEVRQEHSRLVRCLERNGFEHNTPLE